MTGVTFDYLDGVTEEEIATAVAQLAEEERLLCDADLRDKVETAKREIRVRELAKQELAMERGQAGGRFDIASVADLLTRPGDHPVRIASLVPHDASVLIVAQRKTGKTTLLLNLARCLRTGEPFLGEFATTKVTGRVALLNYEVNSRTLAEWADDVGSVDDLLVVDLRGKRNPLVNVDDRLELSSHLRREGVEVIMVDTFGRAFTGASQNDAADVGRFLVDLDTFAREECGASDLFLTAHAGWEGNRTRGSSALEDWPDSILTMTAAGEEPDAVRIFSARGRDVELDGHSLQYDVRTRRLTVGSAMTASSARQARKVAELVGFVVEALRGGSEPMNSTALLVAMKLKGATGKDDACRAAMGRAVELGLVSLQDLGSGKEKLYSLVETPETPEPPVTTGL